MAKNKTRLICPRCNSGFIINPKRDEHINIIGEPRPYIINNPPHCNSCGCPANVTINFETFEMIAETMY